MQQASSLIYMYIFVCVYHCYREMVVVFDCDVGHSMCIRCYVDYIEDALNNRRFKEHRQYGYTIQCPGM